MPNRGRKKKRAPTEKKKETKTSAKEKVTKASEQEKEVEIPEEESQTKTCESEIETKTPEKEKGTNKAEKHKTPVNESKAETPVKETKTPEEEETESPEKEQDTESPEKEEETENPEKESESVRHIPRGTLKVWKVTKDTDVKEASPTVINLAGKTVTIKPLNVRGQNATQESSGSKLSPTKLSPVKPGVSTPPIIGVPGGILGTPQLVTPALVRPVLLPTQQGVSLVRDKDGQQRILIPFIPNLLQPQSPVRQPATAPSTQQKPRPKGRPPYRSYATLKNRASSSRKRRRSVSPASSIESISSISSLSSAPPSPPREASPAPSDASVIIVDVVPSTKEGATLKRAVKTQDYMQEMYRSYRRRKRPRLARTCREILEECVKLTSDINDKEYLRVLHRRLKKIRVDMQSAASKEKDSRKDSQSKKKTPRKTKKASSSTPNGNITDADKIVVESDGEKEDTEEVTLVKGSEIEGIETSQSTKAATRLGESTSNKNGEEEIIQSRLSPMSKEVNAPEVSGEIDAEEETPLVPTSQEMNDDDDQIGSETEKQEAESAQSKTATRWRDLSGSKDQTESDTGTKASRRKRGRPPKNKASNLSNRDPSNQDEDVPESMEGRDGGEPVGLADSDVGAEQSSSMGVTVPTDSRTPTASPRGARRGKKSSDVSPAAAVRAATSPGRKRKKRGTDDTGEISQEDSRETTGDTSATPGEDQTKDLVTSPGQKRRKRGAKDASETNQEESNETKGNATATPDVDKTEPKEQVTRKSKRTDRTAAVTEESPETTTTLSEPQEHEDESTPPAPSSVNKRKGRPPSKHLTGSKETEPQKKQRGYSLRKH